MPYFIDYVTGQGAGWYQVVGMNLRDVVSTATRTIRGLDCISASLRHTTNANPAFGEGCVVASYTPIGGWRTHKHCQQ